MEVRRLEREVDLSCQFNVEIKNEWSYASILPTCLHGVTMDRFKFLGSFEKLRKATISFVMFLCPSVLMKKNSVSDGRIFIKFGIWIYFENLSRKVKFNENLTRKAGPLCEDQYTIMNISCPVLLRTRNFSDKSYREYRNTHFFPVTFFFENRVVYEIMWNNITELNRPQMTIWFMRLTY
jgi:hypothetical protein